MSNKISSMVASFQRGFLVKYFKTNYHRQFNKPVFRFPCYFSTDCAEMCESESMSVTGSDTLRFSNDKVLEMMRRYKEIYGDILVPHAFEIPNGSKEWAEHLHGIKLGILVVLIRRNICNALIRDDLLSMGFVYSPQLTGKGYGYDLVKQALQRYKELNGDLLVSSTFCVPDSSVTWPKPLWGMKLGHTVTSIRRGKSYASMKEELKSMGFEHRNLHLQLTYGYDLVKLGLLQYKEWNGDMLVPAQFRIPFDSDDWAEGVRGMKLGYVTGSIRSGKCYTDMRDELIMIGFDFTPQFRGPYGYEAARVALLNYKELYGDMLIKTKFVVPDGDEEWPCDLWGMKLGQLVSSIRRGKSYIYMKDDLISIGFNFKCQKIK